MLLFLQSDDDAFSDLVLLTRFLPLVAAGLGWRLGGLVLPRGPLVGGKRVLLGSVALVGLLSLVATLTLKSYWSLGPEHPQLPGYEVVGSDESCGTQFCATSRLLLPNDEGLAAAQAVVETTSAYRRAGYQPCVRGLRLPTRHPFVERFVEVRLYDFDDDLAVPNDLEDVRTLSASERQRAITVTYDVENRGGCSFI